MAKKAATKATKAEEPKTLASEIKRPIGGTMAKKAATKATKAEEPKTLASEIKALGVDSVEVIKGDDNGLVYARMVKDDVVRLLSIDEVQAKDNPGTAARTLVSIAYR